MGMEVWDDAPDQRSKTPRRSRIRRLLDRQDVLFLIPALPVALLVFSSLGFKVSGASQAIADLRQADSVQTHSIDSVKTIAASLARRVDGIDSRLDFIAYLGCLQARRYDPSPVLLRACNRVTASQDPQ
jgi:hypothetical protein